jgi:hypothetical protein
MELTAADAGLMVFRDLRRYCFIVSTVRVHEVDEREGLARAGKDLRVFEADGRPVVRRFSCPARMDLAPGKIEPWNLRILGCEWQPNSNGAPEVVPDASYTVDQQQVFRRYGKPLK